MEKFSYEENGYNKEEVNHFVEDVIRETESIMTWVKGQRIQIEQLQNEITKYKNLEKNLLDATSKIEEAKKSIEKVAYEESKIIITEAKDNASRIINDALLRAEKVEKEKDALEVNLKKFKNDLKDIVDKQLKVINTIEEFDIDDE